MRLKNGRNSCSSGGARGAFFLAGTWALVAGMLGLPSLAAAGGFDFPDNGTEALGRGGTFTAKADSPLALEYNVAGLAQQRGTRLLFDNNLYFSSYSFQRAGVDPNSGMPFPLVQDQAPRPFYTPFLGVTTDFGYFDRWTFAVGLYGPSSIGKRSYPIDMMGYGPARYDVISTDLLIVFPTLAAAVRVNRYLDIGLAFQDAIASLKLSNAAFVTGNASPQGQCRNRPEDPGCDSLSAVDVAGYFNPVLQLGLLFHTGAGFSAGLNVRSAPNLGAKAIEATGKLDASTHGTDIGSSDATLVTNLPWVLRGGVRYAFRNGGREVFDMELDATYELWSQVEGDGDHLKAQNPLTSADMDILLPHHYKDTFSIRFGGAFNQPIGKLLLTLRAGFFYDSSASDDRDVRLDFDTLDKLAGTAGLGLTYRGVTLNLAYAGIHSLDRTVTDGRLRPIDGLTGQEVMIGTPVNNGSFSGDNHILSMGLLVQFDELIKGDRWTRKPRE